ncbi:Carboxylic ester hydrolase [Aphelenchoides fujianensis]|nr:Carboxylic ester hydrolase [Aphelenchoides fujianensis]
MFGTCLRLAACCALVLVVARVEAGSIQLEPQAQLKQGRVEGFAFKYPDGSGRSANVFLGLPYAKPPVGVRRFEKPEPVDENPNGVVDATRFGAGCQSFQHPAPPPTPPPTVGNANITVEHVRPPVLSEDCLTLNIMAPSEKSPFPDGFPVLVWIHGGGFAGGSSEMYGFKELAHEFAGQGVVMVTIQFRLGMFGFFSTGDSTAPGNLGLWDQRQALLWIHENIRAFGGNPKKITLWGQNSGAAAVGALSVSPQTRDLFAQSIEMSGSMLSGWAFSDRTVAESAKLARAAGCFPQKTPASRQGGKTADQLVEAAAATGWRRDAVNFARFQMRPDGEFFDKDFAMMLAEAPKKPTIQGFTSQEAMTQTLPFPGAPRQSRFVIPPERFQSFGREDLVRFVHDQIARPEVFGERTDEARARIVHFYADRNASAAMSADPFFLFDSLHAAAFRHAVRRSVAHGANYMNPKIKLPVLGTYSTYEFPYLFGLSVVGPFEFDQADRKLQTMMVMSNPSTPFGIWPPVNDEHPLGFFDMRPEAVLRDNLMLDRLTFWQQMAADFDYDLIRDVDKRTQQPVHLDE